MSDLSIAKNYKENLISFYIGPKHEEALQSYFEKLRERKVGYDLFVHPQTRNPMISYSGEWIAGLVPIKRKLDFVSSRY